MSKLRCLHVFTFFVICAVTYLSVGSSSQQLCGSSRPAAEMSVGAASIPGHHPAEPEPNLLSLHAEPELSQ